MIRESDLKDLTCSEILELAKKANDPKDIELYIDYFNKKLAQKAKKVIIESNMKRI